MPAHDHATERASAQTSAASAEPSDERATEVLLDLVSIRSHSGDERAAVERFVEAADSLGLETFIDGAGNGIARRCTGTSDRRSIALLGHIDTVPGDIPVRIEDGTLHGRGAVDAKGPLVTLLFAAARAQLPPGVELCVIAAVGEETPDSPGARYLKDHMQPDACVIGEPSGWDGVTLGYKGRLIAHARARRTCAHTAGAEASAGDCVVAWWGDVLMLTRRINEGSQRMFDRVQAGIRSLRSDSDGLLDAAELEAGFRLPPGVPPAQLEAELTRLANIHGVSLAFRGREQACMTDRLDPVVRAISTSIRAAGAVPRPKLKTGTSDLNVVAPTWRCPIAAYGPGDSSLDHTPIEHLSLDEFHRAIAVLSGALSTLAAELIGRDSTTCP
ncbi:MAG: [LysW]-lysine hydrolase [Phycisphaerales bacterium]